MQERDPMKRIFVMLAAACAALALCVGVATAPKAQAAGGQRTAYVDVGVATSWVFAGFDQAVDEPAVSNPSDVRLWLENMSLGQEQRLIGDLETQSLYGQRVVILEDQGDWLKVAVEGQPTPRNALGYPGWIPRRQLTFDTRLDAYTGKPFAQIRAKSTFLYNDRALSSRFIELSYATRLPVVGRSANVIEVATPDDGNKWIRASDATVYGGVAAIPKPTGEDLVRTAKTFLGVPYLWAGTSAFGFDCSGFTYIVHRANGVTIPRDTVSREELTHPLYGKPVENYGDLRPGDLAYFAYHNGTGAVHHVGMYIGDGKMIHAPTPGSEVSIVDIVASGWIDEYAGAIRYT
jgi:cell wall-associated NlpC family hydrolase